MADWKEVRTPRKIEGLKPHVRLIFREPEETQLICERALELAKGDAVEAGKLIRVAQFGHYGRTWGDSLFVCEDGDELLETKLIIEMMEDFCGRGTVEWVGELLNRTAQESMRRRSDLVLYLAMLADLGGQQVVDVFKYILEKGGGINVTAGEEGLGVQIYEAVAGQSYWEMDRDNLAYLLVNCFNSWKVMSKTFGAQDLVHQEIFRVLLSDASERLRQIANVMVSRGLLSKQESIRTQLGDNLGYDELLNFLGDTLDRSEEIPLPKTKKPLLN